MFLPVGCFEKAFERGALRHAQFFGSLRDETFLAQRLGGALRFHHQKFVARIRQTGETENLHRSGRAGFLDRLAAYRS